MSVFKTFEEIEAWKKSRLLTSRIYSLTNDGDLAKDYGLRDQIRRASVSVMANIAEGFERGGNKEFIHFLYIAKSSSGELRSHLYLLKDQGYLSQDSFQDYREAVEEISRLISGLIKYLSQSNIKGSRYKLEEETSFGYEDSRMISSNFKH